MTADNTSGWSAGKAAMDAAYGAGFSARLPESPAGRPFLRHTVEQLFGAVWTRSELSVRDRRLLVLGATSMLGRADLIEIQVLGALRNGEFGPAQLEEVLLQIAYYAGWGNASAVAAGIDAAVSTFAKETAESSGVHTNDGSSDAPTSHDN